MTFTVDADGLLSVAAREQGSGVEAKVDVKPSYGLDDGEIARMLRESFSTAEQDIQTRALVEARVDADRLLMATRSALAADGDLLDAGEQARIDGLLTRLQQVMQGADAGDIEAASKDLAHGTEQFAAERMNRGIQRALAGRDVNSF